MRVMDIAAAAGVSPSTVSRVIHGKKVSRATQVLVHRVMRELGYQPGTAKSKKTAMQSIIPMKHHVTVLSFSRPTETDMAYDIDCLNRLSAAMTDQGLHMAYLHWPWNHSLPPEVMGHSEGFLLMQGSPPSAAHHQLTSKPVVSLFCPPGTPGDRILTSYYQVGRLAANYLLRQNIRHLILLRPCHQPEFLVEQGEGFKLFCMKEDNITFKELTPCPDNPSISDDLESQVQEMVDRLVLINPKPLGIFIPSCLVTAMVYRYLSQLGITPGNEMCFVCSNPQEYLTTGLHPKPAIIDIGFPEMTKKAAQLMRLRIENPKKFYPLQISVTPCLQENKKDYM